MDGLNLPSAEYKVTLSDGSATLISVHSDETLGGSLDEMPQAAGIAKAEVSSVQFERAFALEEQHSELCEQSPAGQR